MKGSREKHSDDRYQTVALRMRQIHRDDDVGDEKFQPVVIEARLKLRER